MFTIETPYERCSTVLPLLLSNFTVDHAVQAMTWKAKAILVVFYPCDITQKSLDFFSIGPMVAAQQVM